MGDESPFAAIVTWIVLAIAGAFILFLVGLSSHGTVPVSGWPDEKACRRCGTGPIPGAWLKAFFRVVARLAARLFGVGRRKSGRRSVALETYARLLAGGRAAGAARAGHRDASGIRAAPRRGLPPHGRHRQPRRLHRPGSGKGSVRRRGRRPLRPRPSSRSLRTSLSRPAFIAERIRIAIRNLRERPQKLNR